MIDVKGCCTKQQSTMQISLHNMSAKAQTSTVCSCSSRGIERFGRSAFSPATFVCCCMHRTRAPMSRGWMRYAGHMPAKKICRLNTRQLQHPSVMLPRRRQMQHRAAEVHACSTAAVSPGAEPGKPTFSTVIAVLAAFLKTVSQAMQRTAERVRHRELV